jgi:hypothetical protein
MPILRIQDNCTECGRMRIYLSKKQIQYKMEIHTNHHILVLRDKTVHGIKNLIDFVTGDNIKVEHCEF